MTNFGHGNKEYDELFHCTIYYTNVHRAVKQRETIYSVLFRNEIVYTRGTVYIIYFYNVYEPGVGEAESSFLGSGNTAILAI